MIPASPVFAGFPVDAHSRCMHYSGPLDVVAFAFPCCEGWFPCRECHDESAKHAATVWPAEAEAQQAVLCGACGTAMPISVYLTVSACPHCQHGFNPGCRLHRDRYFDAALYGACDAACVTD